MHLLQEVGRSSVNGMDCNVKGHRFESWSGMQTITVMQYVNIYMHLFVSFGLY